MMWLAMMMEIGGAGAFVVIPESVAVSVTKPDTAVAEVWLASEEDGFGCVSDVAVAGNLTAKWNRRRAFIGGSVEVFELEISTDQSTYGTHELRFAAGNCSSPLEEEEERTVVVSVSGRADASRTIVFVPGSEKKIVKDELSYVQVDARDAWDVAVTPDGFFDWAFAGANGTCLRGSGTSSTCLFAAASAGTLVVSYEGVVVYSGDLSVSCPAGFYYQDQDCAVCGDGIDCSDGSIKDGWWLHRGRLRECLNSKACEAGDCASGYKGYLCASCSRSAAATTKPYSCGSCSFVPLVLALLFPAILYLLPRPCLVLQQTLALVPVVTRTLRWPAAVLEAARLLAFLRLDIVSLSGYACLVPETFFPRLASVSAAATAIAGLLGVLGGSSLFLSFTHIALPAVTLVLFETFATDDNRLRADYSSKTPPIIVRVYAMLMIAVWGGVPLMYLAGLLANRRVLCPTPEQLDARVERVDNLSTVLDDDDEIKVDAATNRTVWLWKRRTSSPPTLDDERLLEDIDRALFREQAAIFEGVALAARDAERQWRFLWEPYRPQDFLWEPLVESPRRVLGTLVVLFQPKTQIIVLCLSNLTCALFVAARKPYRTPADNDLATLVSGLTTFLYVVGLLCFYDSHHNFGVLVLAADGLLVVLAIYFRVNNPSETPFRALLADILRLIGAREKAERVQLVLQKTADSVSPRRTRRHGAPDRYRAHPETAAPPRTFQEQHHDAEEEEDQLPKDLHLIFGDHRDDDDDDDDDDDIPGVED